MGSSSPGEGGPLRLEDLKRRRSLGQNLRDMSLALVAVLVLAWAWQSSDIDFTRVWTYGDRIGGVIFGPSASEQDLAQYEQSGLRQAERDFAGEIWEAHRAEHGESASWTEARFGFPTQEAYPAWLREEIAAERARLGGAYEERIDREVREHVRTEVRKKATGLLPPALGIEQIFGDPDRVFDDAGLQPLRNEPLGRKLTRAYGGFAEGTPEPLRGVLLHAGATVSGEGYIGKLIETVAIAVWATIFAFLLALPASVLGAHRSVRLLVSGSGAGSTAARGGLVFLARRSFDVSRGFNEVVLALLLVAIFRIGPFPGLLALAIHTYGVLGKVFSDAIEASDEGPIEGVKSTGAGSVQTISFALLPQIMPFVVSQTLLRFESNVRSAAILGVVGAGGIGLLLTQKVNSSKFDEVGTILILLIVTVAVIDRVTTQLMKKFI